MKNNMLTVNRSFLNVLVNKFKAYFTVGMSMDKVSFLHVGLHHPPHFDFGKWKKKSHVRKC